MQKGILYVLIAATSWGMLPVIASKIYAQGTGSLETAAVRAYLAALIFIGMGVRYRQQLLRIRLRHLPFYACYGLIAITGLYVVYLSAIQLISGAMACTLMYTAPAFVILFSRLIYKEPITRRKLVGICITFLGCALVVKLYDSQALVVNGRGILLGLLSGLCYSTLTLFGRKGIALYSSDLNTILPAVFGAFFMLFIKPPWQIHCTLPLAGLYLLLALVGSVIPYLFYMKGLQSGLEGGLASIVATFEPVAATLFSALFLGDSLSVVQVLGILLVVTGAAIPLLPSKKRA